MRRRVVIGLIVFSVFALSYMGKRVLFMDERPSSPISRVAHLRGTPAPSARRIVSLAPSVTETIFALGLGERVVGVTRYCDYPPAARKAFRVGGFYDVNYEAVLALSPDLVVTLPEQEKTRQFLQAAGIPTLTVDNKTIPDILAAVRQIGKRCGVEERSENLAAELETRIEVIRKRSAGTARRRVLVSIGGNMRSGSLDTICAAGRASLYGQMIELAGGVNAYQGPLPFPDISKEAIVELNPQVIIDIVVSPHYEPLDSATRQMTMRQWRAAASRTEAGWANRIYLLEKDYDVIPGPRFILALEDMIKAILPEGNEKRPR